jgi:hypothetical protein
MTLIEKLFSTYRQWERDWDKYSDEGGEHMKKPQSHDELIAYFEEMHKQQVKDAYNQGYREGLEDRLFTIYLPIKDVAECSNAENYYNETFNK